MDAILKGWDIFLTFLFVGFYPYILTKILCFGPKGDKYFKGGIVGVIAIWLFHVMLFGTLTIFMFVVSKPTTTLENITFADKCDIFSRLTFGPSDYVAIGATTEGVTMNKPYYTKIDDIDEELLSKIIAENFFIYVRFQLEGFEIKNSGIDEDNWYVSLDGEYLGSIFVKHGLFLTEIVYRWDMEKLNEREDPTFMQQLPELKFD